MSTLTNSRASETRRRAPSSMRAPIGRQRRSFAEKANGHLRSERRDKAFQPRRGGRRQLFTASCAPSSHRAVAHYANFADSRFGEMTMKRLMNDPQSVVREMLEGVVSLRSDVAILADENVIVRTELGQWERRQVAVLSGGGSGHEPAHAG